jgi:hypothetical protein
VLDVTSLCGSNVVLDVKGTPQTMVVLKMKTSNVKSKEVALFVMVFLKFKVYQIGFCAQLGT